MNAARRAPLLAIASAAAFVLSGTAGAQARFVEQALDGGAVRYTVAVPHGHTPDTPVPLVVALHYGGPVGPWYGRGLLEGVVEPALRALGAVMVAPDCPQPAWAECERALARVVDHVQAHYRTAPGRVVLTGYSKGGIGTWALAARAPQRYAAAVVMAARAPDDATLAAWRLPVRVLHGARDELFPVGAAQAAVHRLRAGGIDAAIDVLDGVGHYDTARFEQPLSDHVDWLRAQIMTGSSLDI